MGEIVLEKVTYDETVDETEALKSQVKELRRRVLGVMNSISHLLQVAVMH